MLVLSRKEGERLVIGDGIEVTVLGIRGNRIKLGIACPPEVSIRRGELEPRSRKANGCETARRRSPGGYAAGVLSASCEDPTGL
ncbi:MAG: carbon storage regulator [Planctomycetes bacterium]|nr:carbon storage regulator [Planctomycetota bacterium]